MFQEVLVGVDGRPGGRDAIALARQLAAPDTLITLAHVYAEDMLLGRGGSLAVVAEHARAEVLLERERDWASLDAELVVCPESRVGRGLHMLTERLGADLLVVGSPRHGLVGRVLMGDDTRAALSGAASAVAVAPRGYRHEPYDVESIGVGYDGSPESEKALTAARDLAAHRLAAIWALRVVSLEDVNGEAPIPADWPDGSDRLIHQIDRLAELGDGVQGDAIYGEPREELVRFGENLDLLVVGSRGYGPLGRLFHGSVSDYLARCAPCPLLIMPRGSGKPEPPSAVARTEEPVATGSRG